MPRLNKFRPTIRNSTLAAAEAAFGWYARRRRDQIDQSHLANDQQRTLLQLVRRAQHTKFGREHDFTSIKSVADYRRRVPLRNYEAFWDEYWSNGSITTAGITWPESPLYLALSSGTTSGATKYLPITRELLDSHQRSAMTALCWHRAENSDSRLLFGRTLFLGGSTNLTPFAALVPDHATSGRKDRDILCGDLSGIVAKEASFLARRFAFPPLEIALESNWDRKLNRIAEESIGLPITAVTGVPSWLLAMFDRVKQVSGQRCISDVWPTLELVIHGGTKFDPYRTLFRRAIGNDNVRYLETYPASEGFIAAEDPRSKQLRLITDRGIFFEFVPIGELNSSSPTRHTVGEIVPGVQYAVVLTTCAGLWSYVLGDTVCFENGEPPLMRFTGRTRQFLSAFGEHLIAEEVESAVTEAAELTQAAVTDFHVGPIFPSSPGAVGRHRYLIEFGELPHDLIHFRSAIDSILCQRNEDYRAHRHGNLALAEPDVILVPRGGFARWMQSRGQLGGQHKVPRMDNTGELTRALEVWLTGEMQHDVRGNY